ncbi:MAG: hypothetical protein SH807_00165 [Blastochloris sp.]|nr:hypothetical protein [Blastochloris sp.]
MKKTYFSYLKEHKGFAIISVLLMLGLITIMLVAYLGLMRGDRISSQSYSQSLKAEQLALGGLDLVVKELKGELSKDADPTLIGDMPYYNNVTAKNILPTEVGVSAESPEVLLKRSFTDPVFFGGINPNPSKKESTLFSTKINSASDKSQNGRFISKERWGKVFLGDFKDNESTPNWILMTRAGSDSDGTLDNSSNSLNNVESPNYAIGRIAYAVYDVGGLIDVNVAGHPSGVSPGLLAGSQAALGDSELDDLEVDNKALVAWRNVTSGTKFDTYLKDFAIPKGFTETYTGDNTFVSRGDMIKAGLDGQAGLSKDALKNLTVFSRASLIPTWGPMKNGADMRGNNNTTGNIAYKTLADAGAVTTVNRNLPSLRVQNKFNRYLTKADGTEVITEAKIGEPLINKRFALTKLAWIGSNGPVAPGTNENIQRNFGLVWDNTSTRWNYVGHTGNTIQTFIRTLGTVSIENREPNFFELLKAGILSGSVGAGANDTGNISYIGDLFRKSQSSDGNIIQIGANMIDQADADRLPSFVAFGGSTPGGIPEYRGIESIRYLAKLTVNPFWTGVNSPSNNQGTAGTTPAGAAPGTFRVTLIPTFWNPTRPPAVVDFTQEPDIRIRLDRGTVQARIIRYNPEASSFTNSISGSPNAWMQLTKLNAAGDKVSKPRAMTPADLVGVGFPSIGIANNATPTYYGFNLPEASVNPQVMRFGNGASGPAGVALTLGGTTPNRPRFVMEVNMGGGVWKIYQSWDELMDIGSMHMAEIPNAALTSAPSSPTRAWNRPDLYDPEIYVLDPRVTRFGAAMTSHGTYAGWQPGPPTFPAGPGYPFLGLSYTGNNRPDVTVGPDEHMARNSSTFANMVITTRYQPVAPPSGTNFFPGSPNYHTWLVGNTNRPFGNLYQMVNNTSTVGSRWIDNDRLQRTGDYVASGTYSPLWAGNPGETGDTDATRNRNVQLDRPFRSVGELGQVLRDQPYRTLNFSNDYSGDAGLLDLFTVSSAETDYVAGQINLNTMPESIFKALVKSTSSTIINDSQLTSSQINTAWTTFKNSRDGTGVGQGFFLNKSELATRLAANPAIAGPPVPLANAAPVGAFGEKTAVETVVRALADTTQTNTWNLLIDLVAQSGRYPTSGVSGLNQFIVEGERRYWLHLAIDRYTGKVIDRKLEIVNE